MPTKHFDPEHMGQGRGPAKNCHCCGRDVNGRFLHFTTDVKGRPWCAMCMEFALSHLDDDALIGIREHVAKGPPVEGAHLLTKGTD